MSGEVEDGLRAALERITRIEDRVPAHRGQVIVHEVDDGHSPDDPCFICRALAARPAGPGRLPTFEETRRRTHRLLGDASDELRSDRADGHGPTSRQAAAARRAQEYIARAKAAVDDAARRPGER